MRRTEATGRPAEWLLALESGAMDQNGMAELKTLYLELSTTLGAPLPLERSLKAIPPEEGKMRLAEGFFLADGSQLQPAPEELARRISRAAAVLARHSEDGEKGSAARAAEKEGVREELGRLVRVFLDQGEEGFRRDLAALKPAVDPEVGSFVVFNALKGGFLEMGALFRDADLTPWERSLCPVCGGSPGLGVMEGEGGKRILVCHRCETRWPFRRIVCPFCGNDDHKLLGYLTLAGEESGEGAEGGAGARVRLDTCDSCRTYLKVVDLRVGGTIFPEIEDLLTPRHDLAASQQGYRRQGPNILGVRMEGPAGGGNPVCERKGVAFPPPACVLYTRFQ